MSLTKNYDLFILKPRAAVNLVTDPSMKATTTYTAENATLAVSSAQTRRGDTAMQITNTAGQAGGMRAAFTLTAGTLYTFSADIFTNDADAALSYSVIIANNAGTTQAIKTLQGGQHLAGRWYRLAVSFTPGSTGTYRMRVQQSTAAAAVVYYTDGWMLAAGPEQAYFDGDSKWLTRTIRDFYWNGLPHRSTSSRSVLAYNGGELVSLKDRIHPYEILGAGLTSFIDAAVPSNKGGAFYQNTIPTASRALSISGVIDGSDLGDLLAKHAELENLVNPMLQPEGNRQPVTLRYVPLDEYGNQTGESIDLPVVYFSGLEGKFTNPAGEDLTLVFTSYSPTWKADGESSVNLNLYTDIANANYILQKDAAGTWAAMGSGMTGGRVLTILHGRDGRVYAGGLYTQAGGVLNTARIGYFEAGAWHPMGTGAPSGQVNKIVELSNGDIVAVGTFPSMGGVANTAYMARWDWAAGTWNSFGAPNGAIYDAYVYGGTLYVVGAFTLIGGVALSRIAQTSDKSSTWLGCGTPVSTTVSRVVANRDTFMRAGAGYVYIVGDDGASSFVEQWDGATWGPVASSAINAYMPYLALDTQGRVYWIYQITIPSEIGILWRHTPGAGATSLAEVTTGQLKGIWELSNGSFIVSDSIGVSTAAIIDGVSYLDGYVVFNNNTWNAGEVRMLTAGGYVTAVSEPQNRDGSLVLGVGINGTARVIGITPANIPTTGAAAFQTAPSYPMVKITGPGKLVRMGNHRTRKSIWFNNLTLAEGEIAWLNLDPLALRFYSNLRPDLLGWILQGSDLDWMLQPGDNSIQFWYENTTAASAAALIINRNFTGIAGAGWA